MPYACERVDERGMGMSMESSPLTGILILAGNLDPCANIGTEGRFDLLPIPWTKFIFAQKVSHMIQRELSLEESIKSQMAIPPYDEGDWAALLRGVGLQAWMTHDKNIHIFTPLLQDEWSEKQGSSAEKCIDKIALNIHPFVYRWPDKNHLNAIAIKNFELMLLNQL